MRKTDWLRQTSSAFRLMIATSWLAPDSWRQHQEAAIREAIEAHPDWAEYLQLIDRHGTPGLSWAALSRTPAITIPEVVRQELQERGDACRKLSILNCLLLADVLKRFNQANIPVIPHKGQIFSFQLYQDIGLRFSRDLDVEVAGMDLDRARASLVENDWQLESTFFPMSPRQWESFLRNEQHINYVHSSTGRMLELHWRVQWETPDTTKARWQRSIPSVWQGYAIRAMHPGDMTLYLCAHGGLHAWFRAKWLGDIARAHSMGLLDWQTAWELAQTSNQTHVLLSAGCLLEQVYGLPRPALPEEAWKNVTHELIEAPLLALIHADEPLVRVSPAKLHNRIQISRYERQLWPGISRLRSLSNLFYCREDYRTVSLPDRLFWVYKFLRPFLWVKRWIQQARRNPDKGRI